MRQTRKTIIFCAVIGLERGVYAASSFRNLLAIVSPMPSGMVKRRERRAPENLRICLFKAAPPT
jgi:hypothetical protein